MFCPFLPNHSLKVLFSQGLVNGAGDSVRFGTLKKWPTHKFPLAAGYNQTVHLFFICASSSARHPDWKVVEGSLIGSDKAENLSCVLIKEVL